MVDENGKYTMDDYIALKKAIASGLLEVEFDGPDGERRVRYQSYRNMKKALDDMAIDIGLCKGRTVRIPITSSKGYN